MGGEIFHLLYIVRGSFKINLVSEFYGTYPRILLVWLISEEIINEKEPEKAVERS